MDTTERAKVLRLRDPYLGLRWVIACPFHGVIGRWKVKRDAVAALERHVAERDA